MFKQKDGFRRNISMMRLNDGVPENVVKLLMMEFLKMHPPHFGFNLYDSENNKTKFN